MEFEKANASNLGDASVGRRGGMSENTEAHGHYQVKCFDAEGNLKWEDGFENVVTTVGKNLALDTFLAGSAYTVTGPYLGLAGAGVTSAAAGDTMASHAAWLEVGSTNAPAYTAPRKTVAWSAASAGAKSTSSALTFAITSSGTVGGCFIVFGTGALSTIDNTGGTLYSAGAFTGGAKTVANGDSLSVTYTTSL